MESGGGRARREKKRERRKGVCIGAVSIPVESVPVVGHNIFRDCLDTHKQPQKNKHQTG